jgi:hypothetical protein
MMQNLIGGQPSEGADELERLVEKQRLLNNLYFVEMLTDNLAKKDPTLNFFINIERDGMGHKTVSEMLDYLQENTRPSLCDFSNRLKPVLPEESIIEMLTQHASVLSGTVRQCHTICSKHPMGTDYEVMKLVIEAVMAGIGRPIYDKPVRRRNNKKKDTNNKGKSLEKT